MDVLVNTVTYLIHRRTYKCCNVFINTSTYYIYMDVLVNTATYLLIHRRTYKCSLDQQVLLATQ